MLFHTRTETVFLPRKGLLSLGLAVPTSQQLKYGKSLHIVAAIAMAVLTRKREISTCPHHIPALVLNNTHLLSGLKSNPLVPCRKKTLSEGLFRCFEREIQETGDCGAAPRSTPNVKQHVVFQEFKMPLLNYLTQKLQNVTHHKEIGGEEGGPAEEPTL